MDLKVWGPQTWALLAQRHDRCLCYLEVFLDYLSKIYHARPEHSELAHAYLKEIVERSPRFPDCHPLDIDNIEDDFEYFDWLDLQLFCRDRKNAPIVRLMSQYAKTNKSGHYLTMFKYSDFDDCVTQAVIYHDAYDALEKTMEAKAILLMLCLKEWYPDFYRVRDIRRLLYAHIADCSTNNLHTDPKLGDLFKPPNSTWYGGPKYEADRAEWARNFEKARALKRTTK